MSGLSTAMRLRLRDETRDGRLPLLQDERTQAVGNTVLAGLRHALSAWGLLVGGYIANSVGAVMGMVVLLAGCLLGVGLTAAAALPCNRFGLDPIDAAKAALGYRGAKILAVVFLLNHLAWTGLMLVMFGRGVQNFLGALGLVRGSGVVSLMVILGIVASYTSVVSNSDGLARLRALAMPSLVTIGGIVIFAVLHDIAWQDLIRIPPLTPHADSRLSALAAFECAVGVGLSWWPTVARLSRHADRLRAGFYASWLSLALASCAMGTAGLFAALLLRNYDPTQWLVFLGGRAFGALTLLIVIATNLGAVARMMRATALGLQHMPWMRSFGIGWRGSIALLFAPLLAFVAYPNALYERGDALMITNASLLASLCAVVLVDHMALRRGRLNVTQVFEARNIGHYWFTHGFHAAAWVAIAMGVGATWALYNPWSHTAHPWTRWAGATLPGAVVAAGVYVVLHAVTQHKWPATPGKPRGGYGAENVRLDLSMPDI